MTAEAASYVRLLNGHFSRPDYFRTDVAKGTVRTSTGTRMCVLTDDFLRGFRTAVKFECGKAADRVYKACGRRWGTAFVARFDRELTEHYGVPVQDVSTGLVEKCLDEAFRQHGWGTLKLDFAQYDHGLIVAEVRDPVVPAIVGPTDKPADSLFAGFFAAVAGYFAKTELDCVQTDCPSRGADAARYLIGLGERLKDVPKWVADGVAHAAVVRRLTAAPE